MPNSRPLRIVGLVAGVAVVILACVYYYRFDPSDTSGGAYFPKCPFRVLTGLLCPGCGSQRAIHSLLHLDLAAAWGHNAFMILMLPVIAVLSAAQIMKEKFPRFYETVNHPVVPQTVMVMAIAWWIGRNII